MFTFSFTGTVVVHLQFNFVNTLISGVFQSQTVIFNVAQRSVHISKPLFFINHSTKFMSFLLEIMWLCTCYLFIDHIEFMVFLGPTSYLLTLPLFAGVSRIRALSPAWTGSHARETLISRTHLFLLHDLPPTTKFSPDFEGPFRQLSKSSAHEKNQVQ